MHEMMKQIDQQTKKSSPLHRVDIRIMLIFTFAVIIYAVLLYDIFKLVAIELFLLLLMAVARLSPGYVVKRLLLIFPFGGFIALMQPFIQPGDVIHTWWQFEITQQGLDMGILLLMKMTACVSAAILLSSVASLPVLLNGLKKLHVPRFFITTLNMMIRYIYLIYGNLQRMRTAQKCRGFSIRKNPMGYRFVLKNLGNTISTLFLRSYEKGERVYLSMLARGYTMDSDYIYTERTHIKRTDYFMFVGLGALVLLLELNFYPVADIATMVSKILF